VDDRDATDMAGLAPTPSEPGPKPSPKPDPDADPDATRARIKAAGMKLFSERGIDAASVRAIVREAGARNGASLHYYFGSKEGLIRELAADAARRSDRARNGLLDAMEAGGGPRRAADIVGLMVAVETAPAQGGALDGLPVGFGHMRFVDAMQGAHRALFLDAVGGRWTTSFDRCMAHLRGMLGHLPDDEARRRLAFFVVFFSAGLAAREAAFVADPSGGGLWGRPGARESFVASLCGGLEAPV